MLLAIVAVALLLFFCYAVFTFTLFAVQIHRRWSNPREETPMEANKKGGVQ